MAKNEMVIEGGLRSLELCRRAGVEIGFGSDLLGPLQDDHCREFLIRREVMSPLEILRSATLVNAKILRQEGRLGEVAAGAYADLLVVDGDPLASVDLFQDQGARLPMIMKAGRFEKRAE
jgi:imidazolonepropionase-like amidohydrolase